MRIPSVVTRRRRRDLGAFSLPPIVRSSLLHQFAEDDGHDANENQNEGDSHDDNRAHERVIFQVGDQRSVIASSVIGTRGRINFTFDQHSVIKIINGGIVVAVVVIDVAVVVIFFAAGVIGAAMVVVSALVIDETTADSTVKNQSDEDDHDGDSDGR